MQLKTPASHLVSKRQAIPFLTRSHMENMRGNGYKSFLETIWLDTRRKNFRMAIAYVTLSHTHIILHDRTWLFFFLPSPGYTKKLKSFQSSLKEWLTTIRNDKKEFYFIAISVATLVFFHHGFLNIVYPLLDTVLQLDSHQSWTEQKDCSMFFSRLGF